MITKDDLKDWLAESDRKDYAKKLEEYIDDRIKANALAGNMTFHISAGEYTREGSRRTKFYDVWYSADLSEENRKIVHNNVIEKYRDFGFNVEETSVDCGWHNHYFALKFSDIDKVVN